VVSADPAPTQQPSQQTVSTVCQPSDSRVSQPTVSARAKNLKFAPTSSKYTGTAHSHGAQDREDSHRLRRLAMLITRYGGHYRAKPGVA
jgi:hypothetical protein